MGNGRRKYHKMSMLAQIIVKFVGKAISFPMRSLDKDTKKPTEEAAVSRNPEKSLVPKEKEDSTSASTLSSWEGLLNLTMMMGVVIFLKLSLGLLVASSTTNKYDEVFPIVNFVPKICLLPLSLLLYPVFALLLAYRLEFLLSRRQIRWQCALCFYVAVITTGLALPVVLLRRKENLDLLIQNLVVCLFYIILILKLVSFIQVNKRLRAKLNQESKESNEYPANLSLTNLAWFWFSPTLVYRPQESPCKEVRVVYSVKKVVEVLILQAIARQGMLLMPNVVDESLEAADNEDLLLFLERFLTLAVVFNIVWMISFYLVFVSFLQLMAETSRSQDRVFFLAWWNASTMDEFWRRWNLPVHRWCVKHIYVPFVESNYSKSSALFAVFVTSAILHEYMISCPIQITGHFALVGFLVQPPLMKMSEYVKNRYGSRAGNLLVWSFLVFGNTSGVLVYYKEVLRDL